MGFVESHPCANKKAQRWGTEFPCEVALWEYNNKSNSGSFASFRLSSNKVKPKLTRFGASEVPIDLVPATREQRPILSNLLQLYMHDFSEIISITVDGEGKFEYPNLSLYWSEPGRFPFLAVVNGEWAGFALITQQAATGDGDRVWDMAEFFVLRGYRHQGVGRRLAHLAFERFPGPWQVRVMEANAGAHRFWQQAVESFTGASHPPERTQINGAAWWVFRFESGR